METASLSRSQWLWGASRRLLRCTYFWPITEDEVEGQIGAARHRYHDTELLLLLLAEAPRRLRLCACPTGADQMCLSGNAAAERLLAT